MKQPVLDQSELCLSWPPPLQAPRGIKFKTLNIKLELCFFAASMMLGCFLEQLAQKQNQGIM